MSYPCTMAVEKNSSVLTACFLDTRTVIFSAIVIKPMSNALSCNAVNNSPFLGFTLLILSCRHGTMWLATSIWGTANLVIQHRSLYALKTAERKNPCPIRTVVRAARSSPTGPSMSSSWSEPSAGSATASNPRIAWSDSTAKRSQSFCISFHISRSLTMLGRVLAMDITTVAAPCADSRRSSSIFSSSAVLVSDCSIRL